MGFISRFKPDRAIPRLTLQHGPAFGLYSFPAMRRLSTLIASSPVNMAPTPILTIYIPGNWWADGHEIIWRIYFTWTDGGIPPTPGTTLGENCTINPGGTGIAFAIPTPIAALNTVQGCISRRMIRQGPLILFWDDDFPQGSIGLSGVAAINAGMIVPAPIGGFDFTQDLEIVWSASAAGGVYPATATVDNAIALIAPPLTIRS